MKYYIGSFVCDSDCIYHHGIKGQQHGVRRYQKEDGTLTPLGKIRYGVREGVRNAIIDKYKVGGIHKHSHATYTNSGYKSQYTGQRPSDKGTSPSHINGYMGHTHATGSYRHTHATGSFEKKPTPLDEVKNKIEKVGFWYNNSGIKPSIEGGVTGALEDIKNIPNQLSSAVSEAKAEREELSKLIEDSKRRSEQIKASQLGYSMEKVLDKKAKRLDDTFKRLYQKYDKDYKPTPFDYLVTNSGIKKLIRIRNIRKQVENDPEYKKAKSDYDKFKKMHDNQQAKYLEVVRKKEEERRKYDEK